MVSLCGVDTAREWDLRRFRQNIWFDVGDEAALEGATLTIADAELDVTKRIDRCVMVTRPQPDMERDLNVLRTIHAELDSKLGVGALVRVAGVVSIGDPIEVSSVPTSPST